MTQRRLPPPMRYVYVIGPKTGLQKIGIAIDPRARLAALQTASPFKLIMHASVAVPFIVAPIVERRAHDLLRHVRAKGEWFNIQPGQAITSVKAAADMHGAAGPEIVHLPLFAFGKPDTGTSQVSGTTTFAVLRTKLELLWKVARRPAAS